MPFCCSPATRSRCCPASDTGLRRLVVATLGGMVAAMRRRPVRRRRARPALRRPADALRGPRRRAGRRAPDLMLPLACRPARARRGGGRRPARARRPAVRGGATAVARAPAGPAAARARRPARRGGRVPGGGARRCAAARAAPRRWSRCCWCGWARCARPAGGAGAVRRRGVLTAQGHRDAADRPRATGAGPTPSASGCAPWSASWRRAACSTPGPGRTAGEVARDGGAALPPVAGGLRQGARLFDEVWYGGRAAEARRVRGAGATRRAGPRRAGGAR